MNKSNRRAVTRALVAVGIAIVVLAGVLIATFPWSQGPGAVPGAVPGAQGAPGPQGATPGVSGIGPGASGIPPAGSGWWGYPHYWRYWHGPRFFGGGVLIALIVILIVVFAVRRRRYWGYDGREDRLDPEEILRRTFAEGRITEEEYKSRLAALRK